jgi:hypothetical protein
MDPIRNPFAPGAGAPPPELAGRDALLTRADILFARILAKKHDKSIINLFRPNITRRPLCYVGWIN